VPRVLKVHKEQREHKVVYKELRAHKGLKEVEEHKVLLDYLKVQLEDKVFRVLKELKELKELFREH
jgi:hypothetical protein